MPPICHSWRLQLASNTRCSYLGAMIDPADAVAEAERVGFDISLIEESLSYSYEQRAVHHQEALNLAQEMEEAGRKLRERDQSTATAFVRR